MRTIHTHSYIPKGQTISKTNYDVLNSSKKRMKLAILSRKDAQDSEICLFIGRFAETINCFRDLLTYRRPRNKSFSPFFIAERECHSNLDCAYLTNKKENAISIWLCCISSLGITYIYVSIYPIKIPSLEHSETWIQIMNYSQKLPVLIMKKKIKTWSYLVGLLFRIHYQ